MFIVYNWVTACVTPAHYLFCLREKKSSEAISNFSPDTSQKNFSLNKINLTQEKILKSPWENFRLFNKFLGIVGENYFPT